VRRFTRGNRRTSPATIYQENNTQDTVRYALGLFDSALILRIQWGFAPSASGSDAVLRDSPLLDTATGPFVFTSAQTVLSVRVQIFLCLARPGDVLRGKYPMRRDA
jgi:hypothetical protein